MRIAVFGKRFGPEARPDIEKLYRELLAHQIEFVVYRDLANFIDNHCDLDLNFARFENHQELKGFGANFVISIGGDGTILDSSTLVRDLEIPVLGINTGRLGFLSNVNRSDIPKALKALRDGNYTLSERAMLAIETEPLKTEMPFALNEVTLGRKDSTAMVQVEVSIDGEYFNTYWADGLIIATPTGSTGYSLSCNGPIIMPGSDTFVLTPIAPHNLTARPFVIPNSVEIELRVRSREGQSLLSLDSRIYDFAPEQVVKIKRADFKFVMVETPEHTFAKTLRNKLMWGMDKRN